MLTGEPMERTNVCKSRRLRTPGKKKDTSRDASWDKQCSTFMITLRNFMQGNTECS